MLKANPLLKGLARPQLVSRPLVIVGSSSLPQIQHFSVQTPSKNDESVLKNNSQAPETAPIKQKFSPTTVRILKLLAKIFGYDTPKSLAITVTSKYYDNCARHPTKERQFWIADLNLPPSFQTWFLLTTLHVHLLSIRFRSLPPDMAKIYTEQLMNHFFLDVENRLQADYKVTRMRLLKGYMDDLLQMYRGVGMALDEGVLGDPEQGNADAILAAALWRNVWGGGWGVVQGVKGKRAPKPLGPSSEAIHDIDPVQQKLLKSGQNPSTVFTTDQPVWFEGLKDISQLETRSELLDSPLADDLLFAPHLEKIAIWLRKEMLRMENLSDEDVLSGKYTVTAFQSIQ